VALVKAAHGSLMSMSSAVVEELAAHPYLSLSLSLSRHRTNISTMRVYGLTGQGARVAPFFSSSIQFACQRPHFKNTTSLNADRYTIETNALLFADIYSR
jgi:hypothetical protein